MEGEGTFFYLSCSSRKYPYSPHRGNSSVASYSKRLALPRVRGVYMYTMYTVESRFLEPSISETSRFLKPIFLKPRFLKPIFVFLGYSKRLALPRVRGVYMYTMYTVESRFLQPSISETSQFLKPIFVFLGYISLYSYPVQFLATPHFSNQYLFSLDIFLSTHTRPSFSQLPISRTNFHFPRRFEKMGFYRNLA